PVLGEQRQRLVQRPRRVILERCGNHRWLLSKRKATYPARVASQYTINARAASAIQKPGRRAVRAAARPNAAAPSAPTSRTFSSSVSFVAAACGGTGAAAGAGAS